MRLTLESPLVTDVGHEVIVDLNQLRQNSTEKEYPATCRLELVKTLLYPGYRGTVDV